MIGPILKPDGRAAPGRQRRSRWLVLGLALAALFAASALAMLAALPRPRSSGDYLVAGCLATMVTLLGLLAVLLSSQGGISDQFYKRRRK